VAIIISVLLLATAGYLDLLPLNAMADSSECLEPSCLVVITYDGWDDLQRLASLEFTPLDLQEDVMAAIVTPQELVALRRMGFDVRVLDTPSTPGQYYLVTSPSSGETGPLYRHGSVFPYVPGTFILKADRAEAESLAAEGFFIQKLLGPTLLPTSPPSAEVKAPTLLIQVHHPLIQNLVNSVSQTQIYTTILNLQDDDSIPGWDAQRSRYSYAPELTIERDYIHNRMEALGLDVRYQSFSLGEMSLDNVEGTLNGWGPGSDIVYIGCAHYDSISDDAYNTAPGADDNASGVAAVLEAARVLSQYRFKHTLRFVTFAAEEQGLIGSYYYVAETRSAGTDIGGVINHDMIAWDSDGDDVMEIHVGTWSNSQALGTAYLNAISTYGISLVPEYITSGASTLSDHYRFWSQGYPAMLAAEDSQDFNPYYHQTSDTLDKLDLDYATSFVQTTVATLGELAEMIPPGVSVEHAGSNAVMTDTLIALTVQYANPGPDPATGVVITDTLSPGLTYIEDSNGFTVTQPASGMILWQVGDVMPYTRSSFVVTASVAATLPAGAHLTSTVNITGITPWDDAGDNQATWTAFVARTRLYLPVTFRN
jgi:uncharacterized repeat protein (TIGR01451 family)